MNTARDLAIISLSVPDRPVEQGDLSLALAGAELLDLVAAGALGVDGDDRIVPGDRARGGERLLDEAAALLVRQEPYEPVEEWLWRRGQGLSAVYFDELERTGSATRERGNRLSLRAARTVPLDSPAGRQAAERRASGEPVLAALAAVAGIGDGPAGGVEDESPDGVEETTPTSSAPSSTEVPASASIDEVTTAVLAAVGNAVIELEAVRQQRSIQDAAFDNVWRGL
ncbi:GPP34 family phosphoprotein [Streptomyces kunmingensis]|uniref:GPP34 family phosphoprotein n=1 Tax=Streptomyces kunmingensis TaxID=68225 RepID=A0ABU6C978_9ACTN|nr:GPP34 family phosphoprotein [Streptomyces kunmingensis]MEB3961024.1 GPP34 family phosphoprotein [Streptomyces kunmingensis]